MRRLNVMIVLATVLFSATSGRAQSSQTVEQGAGAIAAELARSWNARDNDAWMACFGPLEGLIIGGGVSHTLDSMRAENVRLWKERSNESWTIDKVQVIKLDDRSAILQTTWSGRYTLATGVTWEFKSSAFMTSLVRRVGNNWRIVAHHNSASGKQVPK
jgi:hypothetical protein